ncbi:MAG: hypothetical protein GF364_08095 [Candidatus Lokiarchaeota archaeon]|nr:hypothetical protein [Candidatus Lokiarchaeota archaeon]
MKCNNENCKGFLPLPKTGYPRLLKHTCNICGFNIVKISRKDRKTGKSFQYHCCPVCFKEFLETKAERGLCYKCKDYKVVNGRCVPKKQKKKK